MPVDHWLRPNDSEWSPRHVAFFDTETYPVRTGETEELRLRCWVAGVVDRQPGPGGKVHVATATGTTRAGLAQWFDRTTVGRPTLWAWAHNLGFDLTVSRLPDELHQLGWEMTQWNLAGRNVSGRMRKRSKGLTLVDSTSWMPHNLGAIGQAIGRPKLTMPDTDAPMADWLDYCSGDVLVLADAVLELLDWWDRNQLGHWSLSGPGCGWNSARHLSPSKLFLIKTEPVEVAHDRSAVRGGRRDVTRVGDISGGPFALVDFSNAYLTIAASQLLPKGRLHYQERVDRTSRWVDGNRFGVIAECEVETQVPRYPVRTPGGVFYPVGRFRTVLASPEIVWARDSGHLRSIGPGYVHDMGYPLKRWAAWALDVIDPASEETPPAVRLMVKQWGRSVIGKFAARSSTTSDRGPALWPGWHLERGTSGPEHVPAADIHIAGRHWWTVFDQPGDNAYPAVLAFVESYVRVALGKMLEELGEFMWVCADTDGAVLDLTIARDWLKVRGDPAWRLRSPQKLAQAVCEAVAPLTAPLVPRVKTLSEHLTVVGPQHYEGDTFSRAAGRPGKPEADQDGHLHWWAWPKVAWQMEHGAPGGFVRTEVEWTHPSTLAHRWILDDGHAVPVEANLYDGPGGPLAAWDANRATYHGLRLAPAQTAALSGLW